MRPHALAFAIGLAACVGGTSDPGTGHPELLMDIVVKPHGVWLDAMEVAAPDRCTRQIVEVGTCVHWSDVSFCEGDPIGAWITELRIERGGAVVARTDEPALGARWIEAEVADTDAELVLVDDRGDEVRIALPGSPVPVPTIDWLRGLPDVVEVGWSASPDAASARVNIGNHFDGTVCHVAAPKPARVPAPADRTTYEVWVTALTAPAITRTAWGVARVRTAGFATTVPAPP